MNTIVSILTLDKEYKLNDIDIDMNIYDLYLLFLQSYNYEVKFICNCNFIINNKIINPHNFKVKDFYKDNLLVINIIFSNIEEYNITIDNIIYRLNNLLDFIFYKSNKLLGNFIRCNIYESDPDGFDEISPENTGIRYVLIFSNENIIIDSNDINNNFLIDFIKSITYKIK